MAISLREVFTRLHRGVRRSNLLTMAVHADMVMLDDILKEMEQQDYRSAAAARVMARRMERYAKELRHYSRLTYLQSRLLNWVLVAATLKERLPIFQQWTRTH